MNKVIRYGLTVILAGLVLAISSFPHVRANGNYALCSASAQAIKLDPNGNWIERTLEQHVWILRVDLAGFAFDRLHSVDYKGSQLDYGVALDERTSADNDPYIDLRIHSLTWAKWQSEDDLRDQNNWTVWYQCDPNSIA